MTDTSVHLQGAIKAFLLPFWRHLQLSIFLIHSKTHQTTKRLIFGSPHDTFVQVYSQWQTGSLKRETGRPMTADMETVMIQRFSVKDSVCSSWFYSFACFPHLCFSPSTDSIDSTVGGSSNRLANHWPRVSVLEMNRN